MQRQAEIAQREEERLAAIRAQGIQSAVGVINNAIDRVITGVVDWEDAMIAALAQILLSFAAAQAGGGVVGSLFSPFANIFGFAGAPTSVGGGGTIDLNIRTEVRQDGFRTYVNDRAVQSEANAAAATAVLIATPGSAPNIAVRTVAAET